VARAFSLIEVIIAVALFVGTVTVILALLPGLACQATDTADRLAAQRLPDAVRVELTRVATAAGLDALATRIPLMDDSSVDGFVLVATRSGPRVQSLGYLPPASGLIPVSERYFLIECRRFSAGSLRYENGQRALALCVKVSWPYGESVPSRQFTFVVSLNP
jgi:hypothetical protein